MTPGNLARDLTNHCKLVSGGGTLPDREIPVVIRVSRLGGRSNKGGGLGLWGEGVACLASSRSSGLTVQ